METAYQNITFEMSFVKDERDWEGSTSQDQELDETAQSGLYIKHEVLDDIVIGPVALQPGDAAFTVRGTLKHPETDEPAYLTIGKEQLFTECHIEPKSEVHTCGLCGKTFRCKSTWTRHIKNHPQTIQKEAIKTAALKYYCKFCQMKFTSEADLSVHENAHEGLYSCDICNKQYARRNTLVSHRRIHMRNEGYHEPSTKNRQEWKEPKTPAQRTREYQERQKIKKNGDKIQKKKIPKTPSQKAKEWARQNIKKLAENPEEKKTRKTPAPRKGLKNIEREKNKEFR